MLDFEIYAILFKLLRLMIYIRKLSSARKELELFWTILLKYINDKEIMQRLKAI